MYVYKITNTVNNKVYIGQTRRKSCIYRFCNHKYELNRNKHHNEHLQRSWNKYGKDAFLFEEIEYCYDVNTLNCREIYWINFYNSACENFGYNIELGGNERKIINESTKLKISNKMKGNKHSLGYKMTSEQLKEHSKRNKGSGNGMFGKTHTEESKAKIASHWIGNKSPFYGKLGMNAKSIFCLTNGKTYPSATHAAKDTGCDRSTICKICRENKGKTKGFEFRFT